MKHSAAGAGCGVCHTKPKNNWEQLGMSNSNFGKKKNQKAQSYQMVGPFHGWGNCPL